MSFGARGGMEKLGQTLMSGWTNPEKTGIYDDPITWIKQHPITYENTVNGEGFAMSTKPLNEKYQEEIANEKKKTAIEGLKKTLPVGADAFENLLGLDANPFEAYKWISEQPEKAIDMEIKNLNKDKLANEIKGGVDPEIAKRVNEIIDSQTKGQQRRIKLDDSDSIYLYVYDKVKKGEKYVPIPSRYLEDAKGGIW